jgi:O-antigen ligase
MNYLILLTFFALVYRAIRNDMARRDGLSSAIWIPTIWVGIIASRPVSMWFNAGGDDTLEGSPIDAAIFLLLIVAAVVVLVRRRVNFGQIASLNWPIVLFYAFLLMSVSWAHSPVASLKRWTKEAGNIAVLLVILTEYNPTQAIRAVFVRCGFMLIPLSLIFLRYFPDIGRHYNIHSGGMEATGVACQKNSLGAMILVCGLIIFWDILEISSGIDGWPKKFRKINIYGRLLVLLIGTYLLNVCDSKTSILCLVLGSAILFSARMPGLRNSVQRFGMLCLLGIVACVGLDQVFGLKEFVLNSIGRDASLTGRTDVWQALLSLDLNPIIGEGFMSFWDNPYFRGRLPYWVAYSAHNGYIEIYIAGGYMGLTFLFIMLLATSVRIHKALGGNSHYAVLRFAVLVITLLANISESNFACMTPLGFIFLLVAVEMPPMQCHPSPQQSSMESQEEAQSFSKFVDISRSQLP